MKYIFTDEGRIKEIKEKIDGSSRLKAELVWRADEFLKMEPVSVTFHKSPAPDGSIHDYFSEGPYWWPDAKNPDGPYVRRDGEFNPNTFSAHKDDLKKMSDAVCILAQAGLFCGDDKYYEKAAELIRVWFLDEKTKMAPHLEYGQAVRGVCSGRGIGIIDTAVLIRVVNGASIIEMSGKFKKEISGLKEWFERYIIWLNTSEKGLEEKNYFNNHSNWWNSQTAAFCAFTGNDGLLYECFEKYKNDILVNQVDENGIFTDEIKRTRSYSYTLFNMTACAVICEIAYHRGIDLWSYETPDGKGIKKCIEFFLPFYENLFLWEHKQINMKECLGECLPMHLAAMRYSDERIEKINESRREGTAPFAQMCHLGILDLV